MVKKAASWRRREADYRRGPTRWMDAGIAFALLATALVVGIAPASAPAATGARSSAATTVTVAFLPSGTSPGTLAASDGISPGLLSAGLSKVPADQTYLDIGQGNRVFDSLYDEALPRLFTLDERVPPVLWRAVVERADSAPADIVPGLLATSLERAGRSVRASADGGPAALVAANGEGRVPSAAPGANPAARSRAAGMTITSVEPARLPSLVRGLRGEDLLIAIERPPPEEDGRQLAIGIAGRGFEGQLTSDSTRLDGLVLSTDLAPTILERLDVEVPDEMSGSTIRADGVADPARLDSLEDRIAVIGDRRGSVIGISLLIWAALAGLAAALFGARGARVALPLVAVSGIYVPAVLFVGGALEPSEAAERLIVGLGCPVLAAMTLAVARGYAAAAIASAVSVLLYAVDVLLGSPLTILSLIGPNPALGVRFFGIGNELEATVATLIPIGVGACLTVLGVRSRRAAAASFAAAAVVGVLVFAPGRFDADVCAAIVLPIGAAVAAWLVLGGGRRRLLGLLAVPLVALAALVGIELLLGGDAHLSRSVLEAGGLDDVADVLERRLRLSADSFARNVDSPAMLVCVALIVAGLVMRRRIATWFEGRRAALAGLLGALAATLVGTLANDSGALVLMIGTGYTSLFVAYAWAMR
jgi:hypothetical protein